MEARRDPTNWIVNAPTTLQATRRYFATGGAPGCKAGLRFLVVTADGSLQPMAEKKRLAEEIVARYQGADAAAAARVDFWWPRSTTRPPTMASTTTSAIRKRFMRASC